MSYISQKAERAGEVVGVISAVAVGSAIVVGKASKAGAKATKQELVTGGRAIILGFLKGYLTTRMSTQLKQTPQTTPQTTEGQPQA